MGHLKRGEPWWYDQLSRRLFEFNKVGKGQMQLGYGVHEVFISIPHRAMLKTLRVYVTFQGIGTPVCIGGIDEGNTVMTEGGFIIYANIQHNTSNVYWLIEYTT